MLKRYFLLTALLLVPAISVPATVSAVDVFNKGVCDRSADASVCKDNRQLGNQNPVFGPEGILTKIINILSIIVGVVAVIIIILAGLRFVTSGSNPQDVANARERIIYACVALVIAGLAQVIVRFIIGRVVQ